MNGKLYWNKLKVTQIIDQTTNSSVYWGPSVKIEIPFHLTAEGYQLTEPQIKGRLKDAIYGKLKWLGLPIETSVKTDLIFISSKNNGHMLTYPIWCNADDLTIWRRWSVQFQTNTD